MLGGLALGLLAGTMGLLAQAGGQPVTLGLALVVAGYAVFELLPWTPWFPSSRWQVPEGFRRTPYVRTTAFLWGVGLGTGWLTMATSAFFISYLGMLAAPPATALGAGVTFGLVRGLTLLLGSGTDDYEQVIKRFESVRERLRTIAVVSAAVGMTLAAGMVTSTY